MRELQTLMWRDVGPFRTEAGLRGALQRIRAMRGEELPRVPLPEPGPFAVELGDWHELRNALLVSEAITASALARRESRGAHQRDDFPEQSDALAANQAVAVEDDAVRVRYIRAEEQIDG